MKKGLNISQAAAFPTWTQERARLKDMLIVLKVFFHNNVINLEAIFVLLQSAFTYSSL